MGYKPLPTTEKLASSPSDTPKYAKEVLTLENSKILVGDPDITRALVALMDYYAAKGGAASHWGGPSAFAEIISALHGLFFHQGGKNWFDHFNFINDAGHCENGIYALRANLNMDGLTFDDLWKFRSLSSPLTGHGEHHLNPRQVLMSNGPLASAFAQSAGLALGDQILKNNRCTICCLSDGACMEGEAREALASIPGIAAKGKLNPYVLVISDNNTKLSGRIDEDSFSMRPTFDSMETLGWQMIFLSEGHDLQKVYSALEEAVTKAKAQPKIPVAVIVQTIKGKGVEKTQKSSSGGHGFPLKGNDPKIREFLDEIFAADMPLEFKKIVDQAIKFNPKKSEPTPPKWTYGSEIFEGILNGEREKVQVGISSALIEASEEGYPLFSLSSDLAGSTGVKSFQNKFPENFLDIGVAESNMISMGAGISKAGIIPIVDTFAQFGITKGNLPLTMANLSKAPVIGIFSHTGFQDAADGASHQATTYIAATAAIPFTRTISLSCSSEAKSLLKQAIKLFSQNSNEKKERESILFFLGRETFPKQFVQNPLYEFDKYQILFAPLQSKCLLMASGQMLERALRALPILLSQNIPVTLVNHAFINRPCLKTFDSMLEKSSRKVVTVEDHQITGGMGQILFHQGLQAGLLFKGHSLGINGHFGRSAYTGDDLYGEYGLSPEKIASAVKKLVEST